VVGLSDAVVATDEHTDIVAVEAVSDAVVVVAIVRVHSSEVVEDVVGAGGAVEAVSVVVDVV
jgi:hypothetical protein